MNEYNIDYFINKVEKIPEDKFISFSFTGDEGKCCINGFLGVRSSFSSSVEDPSIPTLLLYGAIDKAVFNWKEYKAFTELFSSLVVHSLFSGFCGIGGIIKNYSWYNLIAARINNGNTEEYRQPTEKQRILAALYDIKANQALLQAKELISNSEEIKEEAVA